MLSNFIGGGQVFLHKLRMLSQVFFKTLYISLFAGILTACLVNWSDAKKMDWHGFYSYRKAIITIALDNAFVDIRSSIGKKQNNLTQINAKSNNKLWRDIDPHKVINMHVFQVADRDVLSFLLKTSLLATVIVAGCFILIFLIWSKFGSNLKSEKKKAGSAVVLTPKQVKKTLDSLKKLSDLRIGDMPLVKDSEVRHLLITGATGSGKTNLIHNLLPQLEQKQQPTIIIDQTGEMIAKYYNPDRGDIIFNPFDDRTLAWDFWRDCDTDEELERFSKILFGFNRKKSGHNADPFWEQSAEIIFNSCARYLKKNNNCQMDILYNMVSATNVKTLRKKLKNTPPSRYLDIDGKITINSILSVLATNSKPISYLTSAAGNGKFSLKEYFTSIDQGNSAWLFLSTKPSSRELTLPLIACLTEFALLQLMDMEINSSRRVWFVMDELSSLGNLPALPTLMAEGRKYGACIIAGLQSLNQIYAHYGQYAGSSIFGQFGTSFFFRNTEPTIAKMLSSMCGNETIIRQQKNTSFGANEFRDGVSYNEQEQKKSLLEYNDIANLTTGECFVLLPEPKVRIAKLQVPISKQVKNKNPGFIQKKMTFTDNSVSAVIEKEDDNNDELDIKI